MHSITNIFKLIKQILWLKHLLKSQRTYARQLLATESTFTNSSTYQRAIRYATYIPVFIGKAYTQLRNKNFQPSELETLSLLGAMTALFDDLFDSDKIDNNRLLQLLENPIVSSTNSEAENMLVDTYHKVLAKSTHQALITDLAKKIFHAQVDSLKQTTCNLSLSELETISYRKGGYSMQLYRAAFHEHPTELEMDLFFKIGAIGQLENDIFDIYSDLNAGIHTLATQCSSIEVLKTKYTLLKSEILNQVYELPYPTKQKKIFKLQLKLVIERGTIALDYYARSIDKSSNKFEPQNLSKKQLICDMEKPINIVKLIRYAAS